MNLINLATPGVQGLHPYQPGKPLEELAREYGIHDAIKLASNENPLGPSPQVQDALRQHFDTETLTRYPDGGGFALKQTLAQHHDIEPGCITLGNGSNDVLDLVARAFTTSAHSIVYSQHAFVVYMLATQSIGARSIVTPAKNWGHDLDAMLAAIEADTRVVFIANPNNPTGTWADKTTLKNFLEQVREDVIVVVDEAYFQYAATRTEYPDCAVWLSEHPNLVVTRTFSKAYGLASLRIGYALSHPDVADLLNRVRQPFNANSLALIAAEAALGDQAHVQRGVALNEAGMQRLNDAFDEIGCNYIPSVGNFVTVDVGDANNIYDALLRQGVIVRPVGGYELPNHLRVTIGLPEENERFIETLNAVLSKS
ncbi:MAG: histidinol-phosphate transaminase [Pseudomonadota bacterium]